MLGYGMQGSPHVGMTLDLCPQKILLLQLIFPNSSLIDDAYCI